MKQEHTEILRLLTKFLEENPDQRFGQALTNLGMLEFADKQNPANKYHLLRDIYNDTDNSILNRIKTL
jgi:hypothetical protein